MSQTFYLKYRPQTFADLDSISSREELINVFSSKNIPHAFLFTGTKGIGKTSAARIVAKAVNCEIQSSKASEFQRKGDETMKLDREAVDAALKLSYEPCNKCDACLSITAGNNVDVMEIDAASFTGVDDIRDLREKIKLAPAGLKYKVFIIDEVHRLSGSAFDALLKTLEEPPKHVIFILCTTDPEKLPKTIISRCQRINFKKATKKEIVERLKKICQEEKLEFEEEALGQIVKLSEGSFRDAVKFLEQVSFSGKISLAEVQKIAGISGEYRSEEFLKLLITGQSKDSLIWINKAVESGVDIKILLESCLENLRQALLANFGVLEEAVSEITLEIEQAKNLIEILTKAYSGLRLAVIPQLPLEVAVIEWDEKRSGDEKCDVSREVPTFTSQPRPASPSQGGPTSNISTPSSFSLEGINSKWSEILEAVKPLNHSVLAFLKACRPKSIEGNFLILEVFYKFHKDQLESEKCRQIFEKAASGVMNCEVKLKCLLSDEKPTKSEPKPLPPISEKVKKNSPKEENDDIIKVAEEIFNK